MNLMNFKPVWRQGTPRARPFWASPAVSWAMLCCLVLSMPALTPNAQAQQKFESLTIVSASGKHAFQVEVMRNDAQRAQGLMFRRQMDQDMGMLFDFERDAPVYMWMKNTYLPLDMISIDRTGRIVSIAENTEPLSERTIASGGPVRGVLEVNAGTARRLQIKAGDQVQHSMFKR